MEMKKKRKLINYFFDIFVQNSLPLQRAVLMKGNGYFAIELVRCKCQNDESMNYLIL